MSWGHDEYLYHIFKNYLPEPSLYMIRYHSFYAWHREAAYDWLCDDHDREMLEHGMVMYDALYAWCRHLVGETHAWPPKME